MAGGRAVCVICWWAGSCMIMMISQRMPYYEVMAVSKGLPQHQPDWSMVPVTVLVGWAHRNHNLSYKVPIPITAVQKRSRFTLDIDEGFKARSWRMPSPTASKAGLSWPLPPDRQTSLKTTYAKWKASERMGICLAFFVPVLYTALHHWGRNGSATHHAHLSYIQRTHSEIQHPAARLSGYATAAVKNRNAGAGYDCGRLYEADE